ncbi:MAG: transglycosylase SLT domain-containing protein, partial [Clostridia bacterium]|nr:transglycosylase SLT domain-containing protein [Clostridia bacterium]
MKRQKKGEAPLYLTALILCVALLAALGALGYLAVDRMEGLRTEEQGSQVTLAYEEEVLAASQKHGVSAARIYAVILTESSFRPAVISEAGAVGLMQMLPSTYKEQCAKRGVPYDPEDLKSTTYRRLDALAGTYTNNTEYEVKVASGLLCVGNDGAMNLIDSSLSTAYWNRKNLFGLELDYTIDLTTKYRKPTPYEEGPLYCVARITKLTSRFFTGQGFLYTAD